MNELKGKKILIFQQRMWGINVGHFLAKKLQENGCELSAFTLKKTTHEFTAGQKEVNYRSIASMDEIMEFPKKFLGESEFSLEEICDDMGIDSVWPLVYSLRNHVKSYKDKYYYGFRQNVSDEEIVYYVKALYKYIKNIFADFSPDIVLAPNFVALPHIMTCLYARKRGVSMIGVTDSKVKNFHIFTNNYLDDSGVFFERVDKLNNKEAETANRELAMKYIKEFKENFIQPEGFDNHIKRMKKKRSLISLIKFELSPYKQILRFYVKKRDNYMENIGFTVDCKSPRMILRDHYMHKLQLRFANNYEYYDFEKIGKFIYFPLQFQPEATIDVLAPYFSNQIETARLVAMSMPDDYTLVVKDHPAMAGLRPSSYIEKISKTPNIKLVDYRIPTEKILKRADMVISPSSTTIAEAAFLKIPAIQLGDLGTTQKFPNVIKYSNLSSLAGKIKEVLKLNLRTEEYDRIMENFVAAVFDTGFNLKYQTIWEKGKGDDMENLWQLFKGEIQRLLFNK